MNEGMVRRKKRVGMERSMNGLFFGGGEGVRKKVRL